MFVCNVRLNNNVIKKIGIISIVLIIALVFIIVGIRFYKSASKFTVKDSVDNSRLEVNSNNYTDILKDSHDNIDKYIGKKIKFTGFVYRIFDFNEKQFVLAPEMIISSDNHAVVVGFLSEYNNISKFKDGAWVEIEGVIEKGYYHGNIPVIKVENIKECNVPKDEFVYPPDNSYISSEI